MCVHLGFPHMSYKNVEFSARPFDKSSASFDVCGVTWLLSLQMAESSFRYDGSDWNELVFTIIETK